MLKYDHCIGRTCTYEFSHSIVNNKVHRHHKTSRLVLSGDITGVYCESHTKCVTIVYIVYMVVCFVCFCLILYVMYYYCYVYVFLLLCIFCSSCFVLIVSTGTLRLPSPRFFLAFSSVVRQIPGYKSQRREKARTLPN